MVVWLNVVKCEAIMLMAVKVIFFQDVTSWNLGDVYWRFRGTYLP